MAFVPLRLSPVSELSSGDHIDLRSGAGHHSSGEFSPSLQADAVIPEDVVTTPSLFRRFQYLRRQHTLPAIRKRIFAYLFGQPPIGPDIRVRLTEISWCFGVDHVGIPFGWPARRVTATRALAERAIGTRRGKPATATRDTRRKMRLETLLILKSGLRPAGQMRPAERGGTALIVGL